MRRSKLILLRTRKIKIEIEFIPKETPVGIGLGKVMNPDDDIRDKLLRFLHERHRTTKGITKIPIGIRDLQKEMKDRHGLKQNQVASNLDYLIQVGWVKEVVKERSFKTAGGMELHPEQVKVQNLGCRD